MSIWYRVLHDSNQRTFWVVRLLRLKFRRAMLTLHQQQFVTTMASATHYTDPQSCLVYYLSLFLSHVAVGVVSVSF